MGGMSTALNRLEKLRRLLDRDLISRQEYANSLVEILTVETAGATLASEPRETLDAIRVTRDTMPRRPDNLQETGIRFWVDISPDSEAVIRSWLDQHP